MTGLLREVNLEAGMPQVDMAIRRLTYELHRAKDSGSTAVLKIIHGYGSSGTGGRIRVEARNYLGRLAARREIAGWIPGENFSIFDPETRSAFDRCPDLRKDRDLDRHNNGVTFILI